jgi:hypothetical protein
VRQEVVDLLELGSMPSSTETSDEDVDRWEHGIEQVEPPLSNEEAAALVSTFGPDDYFGLAFAIVDLVETAPAWPLWTSLTGESLWIKHLRVRAINGGFRPPE